MEHPSSAKASAGKKTGSSAEASAKAGKYLNYAIGEMVRCPFRDTILVAKNKEINQRAFRYAI